MRFTLCVLLGFFALLGHGGPARAGTPIEFKFQGFYTQTTNTVHPVGGGFTSTLLFDPDGLDVDPNPLAGKYPYLSWTAPGRLATPYTFANEPIQIAHIIVNRESNVDEQWRVRYIGAGNFISDLLFNFPPGTFATDGLPQNLDFAAANLRRYSHSDGNSTLLGTITSLTVRAAPEPTFGLITIVIALWSRIRPI